MGYDHLYYEETSGGHSNDADPIANARRWARHYVYLAQQLMDASIPYETLSNLAVDRAEAVRAFRERRPPKLTGE